MATTVKSLRMPNGAEYNFIGKTWYGTCNTSASTQTKNVTINGFTSADCVAGTRVIVKFGFAQSYNGYPKLSINGIGSAFISYGGNTAGRYEWDAGAVIAFVYDGYYWAIEDGAHASTGSYGKTRLSNAISSSIYDVAATPAAVYDGISTVFYSQHDPSVGSTESRTLLDTTTPSEWPINGGMTSVVFENITLNILSNASDAYNRFFKITYGDTVFYHVLDILKEVYTDGYSIEHYIDSDWLGITLNITNGTIAINADSAGHLVGANKFKLEFFYGLTAGFVSYPVLTDILDKRIGDIATILASI